MSPTPLRAGVELPGRVILVTGAAGGVGATTVALHLASELARGSSACLLDCDTRWGAAARLGVQDAPALGDALPDDDAAWLSATVSVTAGLRALFVRAHDHVRPCIDGTRSAFTSLVVDAPVDVRRAAAGAADAGVLVMPPSKLAAERARDICDEHLTLPWAVVVNRLGPGGETTAGEIKRIVNRRVIELPCTPALRDVEDTAALLRRRWSRWTSGVTALARRLESVP